MLKDSIHTTSLPCLPIVSAARGASRSPGMGRLKLLRTRTMTLGALNQGLPFRKLIDAKGR
jgi:hypothetical protein